MKAGEEAKARRETLLDAPRVVQPEAGRLSAFCFYAAVLCLAGVAAMGCFYTGFHISIHVLPVALVGVACAILCTARLFLGRWKWLATLVLLLIWSVSLWRIFDQVSQGFLRTLNCIFAVYGEKLNLTLPVLAVDAAGNARAEELLTLVAVFLQFPFFWLLSWLFVRHKSVLGSFGLTGLFLLCPLSVSVLPEDWALGLMLLFWIFLLISAPSLHQYHLPVEDSGCFQSSGEVFARPAALLLLPVLAFYMVLVYRAYPPERYERPQFANEIRSGLTEGVNLPAMLRGGTGNGGNTVDLSSLGSRVYTGKTALRVKQEWAGEAPDAEASPTVKKEYLKSFVGSVYTGSSWERLSSEDAAAASEALGEQRAQTLPADFSVNMISERDVHASYILSVRKVDVDPRAIYSPYGLYAPEGAPENTEYVDDGFMRSSHLLTGVKEYALSAVALPYGGVYYAPRFVDAFTQEMNASMQETPEEYQELVLRLQGSLEDVSAVWVQSDWDLWRSPDWTAGYLPENVRELALAAENYNEFVYDRYTQVPDDLRDFLQEYAAENGLSMPSGEADGRIMTFEGGAVYAGPSSEREMYIRQVRELLAENCRYSLTPPALPEGKDFVEYFLAESQEGFCVHFATAAVNLLRLAGIPARYAEGYAAPVKASGEWADVPDRNAHAWVEVYWGGIGWLPVEMTPAGPEAPAAYANAATPAEDELPSQSPSATPSPLPGEASPTPAPTPQTVENLPSPSPGTQVGGTKEDPQQEGIVLFLTVLLIVVGMVFPFFALWALRLLRLDLRKRSFRQRDRNRAALCVYAHLLRLYKENSSLPGDGVKPSEEIEGLALKARFSNHMLTEEELEKLTGLAELLERKLDSGLPKWSRLRCKYLLALF